MPRRASRAATLPRGGWRSSRAPAATMDAADLVSECSDFTSAGEGEGASRGGRTSAGVARAAMWPRYRELSVRCAPRKCDLPHVARVRSREARADALDAPPQRVAADGRDRGSRRGIAAVGGMQISVKKLVARRRWQLSRHKSARCERDHSAMRTLVLTSAQVQRYLTLAGYSPRSMCTYPSSAWAVRKSNIGRYSPTTAPLTLSAGSQQGRSGTGRDKGKAVERR